MHLRARRAPPKLIIGLGNAPLQYLTNNFGINNWRGSFLAINDIPYFACLHPAFNLFSGTGEAIIDFDLRKCFIYYREGNIKATTPNNFTINPSAIELEEIAQKIESLKTPITVDIESRRNSSHINCCGFGLTGYDAICIINNTFDGMTVEFSNFCRRILENPKIEKIFHNAIFDREMFRLNGIIVENIVFDTLVAQHVIQPELPKDLGFLTSIYTNIPCYWSGVSTGEEKQWSDKTDRQKLGGPFHHH